MAENKKADYSVGNKKWLYIVGVLVLLAIIVVIIVICVPGNTYSTIEVLHSNATTSFLNEDNKAENNNYFILTGKYSISVTEYEQEIIDVQSLSQTINHVLDFYDEYLVFADNNSVLTKHYKNIKSSLNKASKIQDNLNYQINRINTLENESDTFQRNAWIDFRIEFVNWLTSMQSAINRLNLCWDGCYQLSYSNNIASDLVLDAVDDYIQVILNNYNELIKNDKKSTKLSSYNYTTAGKIKDFGLFVDKELGERPFEDYYFDGNTQNFYNDIAKFYDLYKQVNFQNVINSINNNGIITETFEDIETSNLTVYANTKTFLTGGVA